MEHHGDAVTVAFGRRRVDVCKTPDAGPVDLLFTYAELGVDLKTTLFLMNPIGRQP